jgi:hypothetical protein
MLALTIAKMPQELQSDASLSALLKVPETEEQLLKNDWCKTKYLTHRAMNKRALAH